MSYKFNPNFPSHLKSYVRVVSQFPPNMNAVVQMDLLVGGFMNPEKFSNAIVSLLESIKHLYSFPYSTFHFGRKIVSMAVDRYKYGPTSIFEAFALSYACVQLLLPFCNSQKQKAMIQQIRATFFPEEETEVFSQNIFTHYDQEFERKILGDIKAA
jgi:hypothetical protein